MQTFAILFVALTAVLAGLAPVVAQQESSSQASASQKATTSGRVFASDAGLVLNFVKPDKSGDFEFVIAKLKEALAKSDKPERKQQASGWKVYKSVEPGANSSVLYLFVMDPAAKGADYTVSTILAEAFPTEVHELYRRYAEAYASGQNVVSLNTVVDFER